MSRRRFITTTQRDHSARPAEDLVQRDFHAAAPDRLWVADITYVPTWAGFTYLAIVLDVFSRCIVGWAMENHLRAELVVEAIERAFAQRCPHEVIHHSRPRLPVHLDRLRSALRATRRSSVDGIDRRLLRQRHGRELLRQPGVRTAGASSLQNPCASENRRVRVHRRLLQSASPALVARLSLTDQLREEIYRTERTTLRLMTVHESGASPAVTLFELCVLCALCVKSLIAECCDGIEFD